MCVKNLYYLPVNTPILGKIMAYTTDAMISVLQKAYRAVRHKEEVGELAPPIALDNFDEEVCFNIGKRIEFFTVNHEGCVVNYPSLKTWACRRFPAHDWLVDNSLPLISHHWT